MLQRRGWVALSLSLAIYVAVSMAMHQPFHAAGLLLRFFDLRIYRLAAVRLLHGGSLYGAPMLHHLGFTYPPFSGLVLAPLAWLPLTVDELAVTGLNVLLLVWMIRRALMLSSRGVALGPHLSVPPSRVRAWSQAAGVAAAALWLEPVSVTLGYGQIDLLIAALIVFDLSRPDHARGKGIAIGVAAAIKLTPLLFIAYLLFSRRGRAASLATVTFVGAVVLSFGVVGHDASSYWGGMVLKTSRIGGVAGPVNQSLLGAIARLTGARHPASAWELLAAVIAVCGVALSARASRRGDEAAGFSLTAITALLASPISWPHHWTLAAPALILLARRALARRSRALGAAAVMLGLTGYAYLPEIAQSSFTSTRGPMSLLVTDPYPLAGLLVLAVCVASPVRARARRFEQLTRARETPWFEPPISRGRADHGARP
jgi:alpha-1,2-mannosyltransferase